MFDKIFKIGLLILGVWFLLVFSQKDRYKGMETYPLVLDSQTGVVYRLQGSDPEVPGYKHFIPSFVPPQTAKPKLIPVEHNPFAEAPAQTGIIIPADQIKFDESAPSDTRLHH